MGATILIIIGAFLFFIALPSVLFYVILFGRHKEKTAAGSGLRNTYYRDYADRMIEAEQRFNEAGNRTRVTIVAKDGIELAGDLFEYGSKRIVIMVHGYMTGPTKNFAVSGEHFVQEGYDLLMIHQRAHGPSGGKFCTFGLLEQYDVLSWVQWCRDSGKYRSAVLYGISMGSASIAFACNRLDPDFITTMIHDSGYTSPYLQLGDLSHRWHIPFLLVIPYIRLLVKWQIGVDLKDNALEALASTHIPAIFLHGTCDGTVSIKKCRYHYEQCGSPKLFIPVEGAEHTLSLVAGGSEVWNKVMNFIREHENDHDQN